MAEVVGDPAGVDEVDIGFDLSIGDQNPLEIDLAAGLHVNDNGDNVVVSEPEVGSNTLPSLPKYLDYSEEKNDEAEPEKLGKESQNEENEARTNALDHVDGDEFTLNQFEESQDVESSHQDDARQSTPVNNIVTSPLADAEESNNDEGLSQSTEEDNPLANLISAALVDVHQNGDPVELNLADSVEVNQRSRFTDDLAVKRQASVPTIVVDICEDPVDQSDDESAEKSMNGSVDKTSDESAEETNDVTVALTNQNEEVVMETAAEPAVAVEPAEQSEIGVVAHSNIDATNDVMADNIIVSTIKRENTEDEDEFDFDLPQKTEIQFDVAPVKHEMAELESRVNTLDVFSEGAPVLEPYDLLQQQVQKTLTESTQCRAQLNTIQKLTEDIPPQHGDYNQIRSWYSTCEYRLKELQRLAQIKLSQVLEAINEKQAQEAAQAQEAYNTQGFESRALQAAEAEWDTVQSITPEMGDEFADGRRRAQKVSTIPLLGYSDVLDSAKTTFNLSQYESVIKTSIQRKGFGGFIHKLFGTKLHKSLLAEQKIVYCLAACPYQEDIRCHWHVLHTVYRRLTGAKVDMPRFGGHWEQIGFQGNDPATDLRGSGFLGLLQLLYLLTDPMLYPLAKDMYRLSLDETQNFPFCIMGINMTRIVMQTLREDTINKECNKRKSVLDTVNELYVATWFHLYMIWKNQHKTISDTGFVLSEVELAVKKKSQTLISAVNSHLAQSRTNATNEDAERIDFQAVCDFDDD